VSVPDSFPSLVSFSIYSIIWCVQGGGSLRKIVVTLIVLLLIFSVSVIAEEDVKVPFSAVKSSCYGQIDMSKAEFLLSEIGEECVTESWLEENLSQEENKSKTESSKDISEATSSQVGGIINSDTVWTMDHSPYTVTKTVQIPEGVRLTIEPGVTVIAGFRLSFTESLFKLKGEVYANGTADNKITFDVGGKVGGYLFKDISKDQGTTTIFLNYCTIRNGFGIVSRLYGSFILKHCKIKNMHARSSISSERHVLIVDNKFVDTASFRITALAEDVHIEFNKFVNSRGLTTWFNDNVYIRYNLFKNPQDFAIRNVAFRGNPEAVIKYNSFTDVVDIAIKLECGRENANMTATENYWGTQDKDKIEDMIYDENDDMECEGKIEYEPVLTEPHPNTPKDINYGEPPSLNEVIATPEVIDITGTDTKAEVKFLAQGQGIEYIKVLVRNLSGNTVFNSGFVQGNSYTWHLSTESEKVSSGLFLFEITVKGNHQTVRSKSYKLVIRNKSPD